MKNEIKIAKQLARIAKSLVGFDGQDGLPILQEEDINSYGQNKATVADKPGKYENFTGYITWGYTNGYVKNATFILGKGEDFFYKGGTIYMEKGTWKKGTFVNGTMKNITWENGICENSSLYKSTWLHGTSKNCYFQGCKWKKGDFYGSQFDGGTWQGGNFIWGKFTHSIFKGGRWDVDRDGFKIKSAEWYDSRWDNGIDYYDNEHGKDDSPDKWEFMLK